MAGCRLHNVGHRCTSNPITVGYNKPIKSSDYGVNTLDELLVDWRGDWSEDKDLGSHIIRNP